jgi:putative phage-type endonuclease
MRRVNCAQRTAEWFAIRCGRVTASNVSAVMAKRKDGKESAERRNYRIVLVGETLTDISSDHYVSKAMERGTDYEPDAKAAYCTKFDLDLEEVGFVLHPTIDRFGASPDGLLPEGGAEFKCLLLHNHIKLLDDQEIPEEYQWQMLANMVCCERPWWDFVSYVPEPLPAHRKLFVKRFYRDDKRIAQMEAGVIKILEEVDEMAERLKRDDEDLVPILEQSLAQVGR